jgi:hypothetical protein
MRLHVLLAFAGLAIRFAVPALAQEQNTVDPEVRQQMEALIVKFDEAFNKNDATATAALYTQDAAEVVSEWSVGFRSTSHREKACSQLRIESRQVVPQASSGACDRQRNMRDLRMEYAADQNQRRPLRSNDLCS